MSLSSIKVTRPAPPRPAPKPGQVKVFRAQYKYDAQQSDELSFDEGDLLYVYDMTDPSWWKARCCGNSGLIPSNYVEESMERVESPLHEGAKRGNVDFVRECLSNNVSVNGLDRAHCTPLHWAAHGGHVECMKILMAIPKCEISVPNKLGDTALHAAAWKGHPEAVKLLLVQGAIPFTKNNEKKTPFHLAKDPQSAALLQQAMNPRRLDSKDYGNEEDSD